MEKEPDQFILALGFEFCDDAKDKDECDFCTDPQNGTYASMYRPPEDAEECEYIICGKCIVENQKRNKGKFNRFDLPDIILPF